MICKEGHHLFDHFIMALKKKTISCILKITKKMIQNFFIVRQNWNIGLFVFIQRKASVLGKVSGKLNLPRPIKGPV